MSLIHLPQEGLFSREDRAVDVKRNYFAQDRVLILWVYTIFSLLLRGGCFGILYLARQWEFLEHPSFPFLGCLHPQVPLHKAVGYQRGRKGGQARRDCRFGGCEGVWRGAEHSLTPAALVPVPCTPPRPQHAVLPRFFPLHPGGCSPSAVYHFSSYRDRGKYFLYMKNSIYGLLAGTELCTGRQGKLW